MTTMVSIFDCNARVVVSPPPPLPDASSPLTHPTKAAEKPRATHKARQAFDVKFIGAKYTHYLSGGVAPTPLIGGAQRLEIAAPRSEIPDSADRHRVRVAEL